MEDALTILSRYSACEEACEWVASKTTAEAWAACERPDWILWIIRKINNPALIVPLAKIVQAILVDKTHGILNYAQTESQRDAINNVAVLYQQRIDGDEPSIQEWCDADRHAYATATTTTDAAYAAAAAAFAVVVLADAAAAHAATAVANAAGIDRTQYESWVCSLIRQYITL